MWLWLFYLWRMKTHGPAVHHTDGSSAITEMNKCKGKQVGQRLLSRCIFTEIKFKQKKILIKEVKKSH